MSMTLHDRTTKSLLHLHKKKKPPSISAQFQVGDTPQALLDWWRLVLLGKPSGFYSWDLFEVDFIAWLESEYILRCHLCHEMCQLSVLIILVCRSSATARAHANPALNSVDKSWQHIPNNRDVCATWENLFGFCIAIKPETTWFLRQKLSCCQTPLKMLIPEEKPFWMFHFRLHLTNCWRHWAELSHSSSAASAPMQRR